MPAGGVAYSQRRHRLFYLHAEGRYQCSGRATGHCTAGGAASATAQAGQLETTRQETTSLVGENTDLIADLAENIGANLSSINTESGRINALGSNLSALSSSVDDIVPGLAADEIYQQVSHTIVEISDGDDTVGTGFLWRPLGDPNDYVLTAYHVIEDLIETKIRVILADGTISKVSITGSSIRSDVALLKLESSTSLAPATMADSSMVAIGDHTLVVGHPFDEDNSLTIGVVSQLNRFEEIGDGDDERWVANLIQFDAPANFGNSGGPIFDANGKVIGMVVARVNPFISEGISYAVSSNKIERVVDDIITRGSYYYLTLFVHVTDMTPAAAEAAGLATVCGALVEKVVRTPPESDEFHIGDIIMAIDDFPIDSVADLASCLGEYSSFGEYPRIGFMNIYVIRDGTELTLKRIRAYCIEVPWHSTLPEEH